MEPQQAQRMADSGPKASPRSEQIAEPATIFDPRVKPFNLARLQRTTILALQRTSGNQAVGRLLQRAERLGTRVTVPKGTKRPFKTASATFNGQDFVLTGDGAEVLRAAGQSGRPITVRKSDAKKCGGTPDDSYLNNPRYVGIADNGPIPEGEYSFRLLEMTTFTAEEQLKMTLAAEGEYVDPKGLSLHGDWGAARGALNPIRIEPSKFGGSTATRSGFYLHGGVMPGSSGCIDIGNSSITDAVSKLLGYLDPIHVTVKYTSPPPDVGALDRAAGRFMYPPGKKPSLWDRLGNVFGGGDQ